MTIIDVHAHVLPASAKDVLRRGGGDWFGTSLSLGANGNPVMVTAGRSRKLGTAAYLGSPEERLDWMDSVGIDVQVLSLAPPLMGYDLPTAVAAAMCRHVNDHLVELTVAWPDRFRALATLPAADADAAVSELQRVMTTSGVVGVQLGTNVQGASWDAGGLFPVLSAAEQLGAFVFLHPNDVRAGSMLVDYHLGNLIGNPLETTAAAAALIFGGVLDRLPALDVCLSHGGGYLALAAGRFDHGHLVRPEARRNITTAPSAYLERLYVDALVHSPGALRHVIDTIGSTKVVLGTDHPADMGWADPVRELNANPLLSADEKARLLSGNLGIRFGLA